MYLAYSGLLEKTSLEALKVVLVILRLAFGVIVAAGLVADFVIYFVGQQEFVHYFPV